MKTHLLSITALAAAALLAGTAPLSANATWNGSTGEYDTGTNWSPNSVPGTNTDVTIGSGKATWAGVTTGTGNFNRTGSASLVHKGSYFIIAGGSTTGTLNQTGGAITVETQRGFFISDGATSAGSQYNMSGGTLNVTSTGTGTSATNDSDQGLRGVWLGKKNGSTGDTFNLSGNAQASFTYSNLASRNARVYISNASSITIAGNASLSFDSYTSVDIGGHVDETTMDASKTSTINVSGGSLTITDSLLNVGKAAKGELIIRGGTVTVDNLALNSNGTIELSGGILFIVDNLSVASGGTLEYSGGTLKIKGDYSDLSSQNWFNDLSSGAIATYDSGSGLTTIIPEPSTYAAVGTIGLLGLLLLRRRRQ